MSQPATRSDTPTRVGFRPASLGVDDTDESVTRLCRFCAKTRITEEGGQRPDARSLCGGASRTSRRAGCAGIHEAHGFFAEDSTGAAPTAAARARTSRVAKRRQG
jgi:hypothetical protein